ncbi:unnamed protein product [Euphydryas editha]|uniref:Uncharacterized protein n=1 Tax=Euphydryas editha TaxID=104508 RepID=A0AAU9UJS9_EUPED|nr:unnamed protein product [Euphydryas editha]
MGDKSTAVDSDDDISAATARETSRSGKRPHGSPRLSGLGSLILVGCKRHVIRLEEPCYDFERVFEEAGKSSRRGAQSVGCGNRGHTHERGDEIVESEGHARARPEGLGGLHKDCG